MPLDGQAICCKGGAQQGRALPWSTRSCSEDNLRNAAGTTTFSEAFPSTHHSPRQAQGAGRPLPSSPRHRKCPFKTLRTDARAQAAALISFSKRRARSIFIHLTQLQIKGRRFRGEKEKRHRKWGGGSEWAGAWKYHTNTCAVPSSGALRVAQPHQRRGNRKERGFFPHAGRPCSKLRQILKKGLTDQIQSYDGRPITAGRLATF